MKGRSVFYIGMAVAAVLLFLLQLRVPQKFSWKPSFSTHDRQPFGCYVFDSIAGHTVGNYQVAHKTFRQIYRDPAYRNHNVLMVTTKEKMTKLDADYLDSLLQRGTKVLLAYAHPYYNDSILHERYGIVFRHYGHFRIDDVRYYMHNYTEMLHDTIEWISDVRGYSPAVYSAYRHLVSGKLSVRDTLALRHERLAYTRSNSLTWTDETGTDTMLTDTFTVLSRVKCHGGELIVSSTPLLFTNYGVLDRQLTTCLHRMLTLIADRPVLRTTAYMDTPEAEAARQSPFRYLLSQRPLRWALWLSLLLVALFMVFTARRRQRVIPIETPPRNHTLEFVQLIGTLYYQQKDHVNLLCKEHAYFADRLRSRLGIDITEERDDRTSVPALAKATGMDEQEIKTLLHDVRRALLSARITESQLHQLIGRMKEVERLKG